MKGLDLSVAAIEEDVVEAVKILHGAKTQVRDLALLPRLRMPRCFRGHG